MAEKYKGTLAQWDDKKGFGFIEPRLPGPKVFVHISDFVRKTPRPEPGQQLVYQRVSSANGKDRAVSVVLSSRDGAPLQTTVAKAGLTRWSLILTLLFSSVLAGATWLDVVPQWLAPSFLLMSICTFGLYALDKQAARSGQWRTSEATLLIAGLCGGWPGGVAAQHWLRHKTVKTSFRVRFWATVALNCCVLLFAYDKHFFGMPYGF